MIRAIVTDIPGTTSDLVSETASIGGIPVKLYDTAGIREASELVESLGIERSLQAMADAGLTLVVVDVSQPAPGTLELPEIVSTRMGSPRGLGLPLLILVGRSALRADARRRER